MQGVYKKFRKGIRIVDVFGTPIQFNFDGQEVYKSAVGGFCTIIVTVLMFVAFSSQIGQFVNKETTYFETNSSFTSSPSSLQLNNKNFMFALKIEQSSTEIFNEQPYFNILLSQQNYTINNGSTTRNSKILEFEPCKLEKFSQFGDTFTALFSNHKLSEFICPTDDTIIYLEGSFLNAEFHFAKLQIQVCNQYTNQSKWNVTCAAQSQIDTYLKSNGQFRLVLYTTNYVVNPSIANQYYYYNIRYSEIYLSEDLNFLFQPGYLKQSVNVYYKEYEVSTDQSLFINQDFVHEKYIFREEGNYKLETVVDLKNSNSNSSPLTIYFRSDFFKQSASRKFQKIDQLLAYFGGIFHILVLVFSIFVKYYNSTFYQLKMANRLYQFTNLDQRKVQIVPPEKFRNLTETSECEDVGDKSTIQRKKWKSKLEYLYYYFKNYIIKSQKVYPELEYIGYLLTCRKKFGSQKHKLIDESIHQIQSDSNVRILIKKIQEIDKLKSILLDQEQLKLFNFMQRPVIQISEVLNEKTIQTSFRSKQLQELRNFQELIAAYSIVSQKQENSIISTKIIISLGHQMNELLHQIKHEDFSDNSLRVIDKQQYIII